MSSLKRPLAVLGLSMFLTVLCAVISGNTALVVAMTVSAAVGTVAFMIIKSRHSYTLITFSIGVLAASLLFLTTQYHHDLTVSLCGENRCVEAVVTSSADFSEDNARYYVEARLKNIDSRKAYGKIRLSFSRSKDGIEPASIKIGDTVRFEGFVYKIGLDSDEIHNSFISSGIYTGAYSIKNFNSESPGFRPLTYYTDLLRQAVSDKIVFNFNSDVSGLVIGILTGDKDFCDNEVYRSFRIAGAAHILAVSGLHMSIWISVFGMLFAKIKKRRKISYVFILIFVALTVFVADFSPSVCRSALMSCLYLIGKMVGSDDDSLNSLGFAAVCIIGANVYVVYSIAFQLTFICILSIIVLSGPLCDSFCTFLNERIKIPKVFKSAAESVASCVITGVTVSVFTFPVCAYHFGYISVLSPITNLLIIPVCAPLMVASLLYLTLSFIPGLSDVLAFVIRALSGYMIKVTEKIASSSVACVSTGEYEIITWIIIVSAFAFILLLYRAAHRYFARFVSALLAVFVMFSFFASVERKSDGFTVRLVGNGEEVSAVIIYNGVSVVAGVYDRYYFTEEIEFIAEGENTGTVAVLPPDNTDERFIEYLCADLDAQNVVYNGESVTLFEKVKITNRGEYALIEGCGRRIAVIYKTDLQPKEYCDIIIKNDTAVFQYTNEIYIDEKLRNADLSVNGKGTVRIRGEKFWQNLTKKDLNPT